MPKRQFHLAFFLSEGFGPKTWRGDWPGSDAARWMMPDLFIDLATWLRDGSFNGCHSERSAPGIEWA